MCIIADPPTLLPIFKCSHSAHDEFEPVRKWIMSGPGKLVMGGTQYKTELENIESVLNLVKELAKIGKVVKKDDATVDQDVVAIKSIEPTKNFDDPHLVALARLSGCKLICIIDDRAHRYLTKMKFYKKGKKPKLYTRASNCDLLCNDNIAPCCR